MGKKIVLFGGSFDLLHCGHVVQIKRAKALGDYLIVNVSSDEQVKNKKGKDRPIIPWKERAFMVNSIKDVDKIVCKNTDKLDLPNLLDSVKPDVLVTNVGNDDYDEECKKRGIKLVKLKRYVPLSELDTSKIINKIRKGGK